MSTGGPDVPALQAEVARLREALEAIKNLRSEPIGSSGFMTGPQVLVDAAKRIARAVLAQPPAPEDRT